MRNKTVRWITQGAVIAAIYVVLTVFISAFNLASGSIQIRISEALCILPYFTPAAVPGLWLGCFLANLVTGASIFDVVFGSLATLIGALGTYALRKHKVLCTLPPVLSNAVIVPLVLIYAYGIPAVELGGVNITYLFNFVTVGIGEVVSVCVLGSILLRVLEKYRGFLFEDSDI
ncbi:MAG: QueT transporter family protein [Clostridiales bacterium]|nr:QueT transporter family protein [Clostridiales bacterium]